MARIQYSTVSVHTVASENGEGLVAGGMAGGTVPGTQGQAEYTVPALIRKALYNVIRVVYLRNPPPIGVPSWRLIDIRRKRFQVDIGVMRSTPGYSLEGRIEHIGLHCLLAASANILLSEYHDLACKFNI
jgi:hypothetical protein